MNATCPACRHEVETDQGGTGKCRNCGTIVRPPEPWPPQTADTSPPAAAAPPTGPAPPVEEAASTRAASIIALICGLVFFVPFITQVLAIVFASVAIFRRRLPNERVAVAWVGMALAAVTFVGWFAVFRTVASRAASTAGPWVAAPAWNQPGSTTPEDFKPGEWSGIMKTTHDAVSDYYRDFRKWPPDLKTLVGRYLRQDFQLPGELIYRPLPDVETDDQSFVLMVSDETLYDLDNKRLDTPQRLILRLSGKIELLPTDEVEKLLKGDAPEVGEDKPPPE